MSKDFYKCDGFTLIETIIYIAIVGILATALVSFGLAVTQVRNKNYVIEEVQANARVVMDFLADKIRESQTIVVPVDGMEGNVLELAMQDSSDNFVFSLTDGVLYVTKGTQTAQAITGQEVLISQFQFLNLGGTGERDSVKINMTFQFRKDDSRDFIYSQELQTTVSLRL